MTTSYSFKFIIIGSSGVGKTAILKRLVEDTFSADSQSTIGVEFDSTMIEVDNQQIKLQIWDTAGQERFRSIAKAYFRNAVGVILVFVILVCLKLLLSKKGKSKKNYKLKKRKNKI